MKNKNELVENEKKMIVDFFKEENITYDKKNFVFFNGIETIKIYDGKKDIMSYEITQELIDNCKKIMALKKKYEKDFENKKKTTLSNYISLIKYSKKDMYEYSTTSGTVFQNLKLSLLYYLNYDVENRAILKKFIVGDVNEKSENQLLGIKVELVDIFICKQNIQNTNIIKKYYYEKDKMIETKKTKDEKNVENHETYNKKENLSNVLIKNKSEKEQNNKIEKYSTKEQKNKKKSLKPIKFKEERLECLKKIKELIKYDENRNVIFEKNLDENVIKYFNDNIYPKILLFFDSGDFKRIDVKKHKGFILIIKKIFKEFNCEMVQPSFSIKNDEGVITKDFYYVTDISKVIS